MTASSPASIELVAVGNELLLGHTIDTNAAYAGQALAAIGVPVLRRSTVGDDPSAIIDALREALARTGLVIVTGGLGPTRDDVTREAVATLLGMPLAFDENVWRAIEARYATLGRAPAESNRRQAMVPVGGTVLPNRWGTAPGLWLEAPPGTVILLPGVPHEMTRLLDAEVIPRLAARGTGAVVRSRSLRTSGIPESTLAERVERIADGLAPLTLAYLPGVAGVDLRLTSWHDQPEQAALRLADGIRLLRGVADEWAWGEDDDDLAAVVLALARAQGERIAVAESCTGGMIASRLTDVPGSSDVFMGGVVSYADAVKRDVLAVPAATIGAHGAVSEQVAHAMAEGAARQLDATLVVAVTGIAGPAGGAKEKPVGTTWYALRRGEATETWRVVYPGSRPEVRSRAAAGALMAMWRTLRR